MESLAEAFASIILNSEGEFIWKKPRDSPFVECPCDPAPDILDDFRRRKKTSVRRASRWKLL